LAHRLKRLFEAAARLHRGANYQLQADRGAFADFLQTGMTSYAPLRDRAVAIINGEAGYVEIYRAAATLNPNARLLALYFSSAHYQWLRWCGPGPTMAEFTQACQPAGAAAAPPQNQVPLVLMDAIPPVIVELDD